MSVRPITVIVALATAAVLAAVLAIVTPPAQAKDGDIRVRGKCTAGSTAKLKLSEEDGRIEVEFEVDQNRNGVRWQVALRRNGRLVARTVSTTRAPSGSFEVRRVIANVSGPDRVVATATRRSGERCTARATF
jgi:hypothetical protein